MNASVNCSGMAIPARTPVTIMAFLFASAPHVPATLTPLRAPRLTWVVMAEQHAARSTTRHPTILESARRNALFMDSTILPCST
jgi:hypothetical protein